MKHVITCSESSGPSHTRAKTGNQKGIRVVSSAAASLEAPRTRTTKPEGHVQC